MQPPERGLMDATIKQALGASLSASPKRIVSHIVRLFPQT
jgi:hypothetical protein